MMRFMTTTAPRRWTALVIATSLLMPALAGCGSKGTDSAAPGGGSMASGGGQMAPAAPAPQKVGLSGKQKVVLLAGAALLYYIYKKDVANNNAAANSTGPGGKPQLYREEKGPNMGAIYYRDPQTHKPVWVTAPSGGVSVPADSDALAAQQQYGNQPAPQIPAGQASVPATRYDPSLMSAGSPSGPPGPGG